MNFSRCQMLNAQTSMTDQPDEFWLGVDQFNQHQFYACHDTLEALWMEAMEPDKTFYQGILQIAVALYHLGNQNWRGAVVLLGEGVYRLRDYDPDYGGIALEDFLGQAAALLEELQQTGPEQVSSVLQLLGYANANGGAAKSEPRAIALPVLKKTLGAAESQDPI